MTLLLTLPSMCMTIGQWTGKKSRSAAPIFYDLFIKDDFYMEMSH